MALISMTEISEEIMYHVTIHTLVNESENDPSAVFLTFMSKSNETKTFLLQFPENNIHPLQSHAIDLYHFIDQDIGLVSQSIDFSNRDTNS